MAEILAGTSMTKASNNTPLISVMQLQELMHQPQIKLFDVRGTWSGSREEALTEYLQGHIPRAQFLDWKTHFLQQGVPTNLAAVVTPDEALASLQQLGISADDHVVLYDNYHHMLAGRIWWSLRYLGFKSVHVVEGGWHQWQQAGLAVTTGDELREDGEVEQSIQTQFLTPREHLRIDLEHLINVKETSSLIDARGPVGYSGQADNERTGHIPGAINVPFRSVLDEKTGLFKSNVEIETILTEHFGDFRKQSIISSCGSGYAGTVILLALQRIGIEAPLYDGSFAEWKQDSNRQIEQSGHNG